MKCKHIGVLIGVCLVDEDTGFVQELYECSKCGKRGQVANMYPPEVAKTLYRTPDCIVVSNHTTKE
jgi:hypothetical protein